MASTLPDLSFLSDATPSNLGAARNLYSRGLSLIPVEGKKPALPWKQYQTERPKQSEIEGWFGNGHWRNIGVVTGKVSGIVVVDTDSPEAEKWANANLPQTPWVVRTAKGKHRYYRHPGTPVPNKARIKSADGKLELDVRGDGGQVVGPESIHDTGALYEWDGWSNSRVSDLPPFDPRWLKLDNSTTERTEAQFRKAVAQFPLPRRIALAKAYVAKKDAAGVGERDHTAFVVARTLVSDYALPYDEALPILQGYIDRCDQTPDVPNAVDKLNSAMNYGVSGSKLKILDFKRKINPDGSKGAINSFALDNVRLALERLGVRLTYNALTDQALVNGQPLDDAVLNRLWVQIDDNFGFRPSKELLQTVLTTESEYESFHPVRDYLDSLEWDGTPRLESWLIEYGGAEDTPYVRAASSLPLIAAVRRVRQPGCKFDELLVLEGAQGTLKSSAVRSLCPVEEWYSDALPLGADSKLVIERTSGSWIVEASELHGYRGKDVEALKACLSRQKDGPVRLAYGRFAVTKPREFIVIGTTNSSAYLKDSTGGRRFWPVTIPQAFDLKRLAADRDQLWAEAAAMEAAGASIRLDPQLYPLAGVEQEARRVEDPWETQVERFCQGKDKVDPSELWQALGIDTGHLTHNHSTRIAEILSRLGYKKMTIRLGDKPIKGWKRA